MDRFERSDIRFLGVSEEPKTTIKIKKPSKKFRRNMSVQPPIVDPEEVERRFEEILVSIFFYQFQFLQYII